MKVLLIVLAACYFFSAGAGDLEINQSKKASKAEYIRTVSTLVNQYYIEQNIQQGMGAFQRPPPNCDDDNRNPDRISCIDAVCAKLGSFGCDDASEVNKVAEVCRGVGDGACINTVCGKLGSFGCDDIGEVQKVGDVCRKVYNTDCVDEVCRRLGSFGCDDISEMQRVGGVCAGRVDVSCIRSVCERLGSFGCDDIGELEQVGKTCSGRK